MSATETRSRGIRGHDECCRGARAESSSLGNMPNLDMSEIPVSPTTKTGSQSRSAGDDALSQAFFRVLERIAGPYSGSGGRGSVTERLRSNRVKMFRGVTGVAPTVRILTYGAGAGYRQDDRSKESVQLLKKIADMEINDFSSHIIEEIKKYMGKLELTKIVN
ncbi:hypothetical protein Gotur_016843 [Gossypium turneri]